MGKEIRINGVTLSEVTDETMLSALVNSTEDFETRKALRARLQQLKSEGRVSSFETEKPANAATFRSSNGVPQVVKVNQSAPSTPQIDIKKAPSFHQEQPHLDAYERALRARKADADERKRRTLAAYDAIARSGVAGPKIVVREELEHMDIPADAPVPPKPKYSCTTSFSGGYMRS